MISAVAVAFLLAQPRLADTVTVPVDQDVWVYPHAGEPASDSALRIWGVEGKAVAASPTDAEEFSYGFLRVSLTNVATDKKLVGASLYLTAANAMDALPEPKAYPLEVRPLSAGFTEKDWTYELSAKVFPSATVIYGTGVPLSAKDDKGEVSWHFDIDLLGKDSKFKADFEAALKDKKPLHFALTSRINPGELGRAAVYKVFSRDNKDETVRPKLVLKFE